MGSDKTKTDAPGKTPPSTSDKAKPAPELKTGPAPASEKKPEKPKPTDAKAVGGNGSQPAKADAASRLQRSVGNQRANHLAGGEPLPVSHPSDPAEKHAEAVAKDVAAGKKRDPVAAGTSTPSQPTMHRAVVPTHPAHPEPKRQAPGRPAPGKQPAHPVQGQPAAGQPTAGHDAVTRAKTAPGQPNHDPAIPGQSTPDKAPDPGEPIPQTTRGILEHRMHADLSAVRIHRSMHADALARSVHARAVTKGHDIWLASDASPYDIELMAHEATHALHGDTGHLHRAPKPGAPSSAIVSNPNVDIAQKLITIPSVGIVQPQASGGAQPGAGASGDGGSAAASLLGLHNKSYLWHPSNHRPDNQRDVWRAEMADLSRKGVERYWQSSAGVERLRKAGQKNPPPFYFAGPTKGRGRSNVGYAGTPAEIGASLVFPPFGATGESNLAPKFQVDHIAELQYGGLHQLANMQLLDATTNGSAGRKNQGTLNKSINDEVDKTPATDRNTILGRPPTLPDPGANTVYNFIRTSVNRGIKTAGDSAWKDAGWELKDGSEWRIKWSQLAVTALPLPSTHYWSRQQLENGDHAKLLVPTSKIALSGTANNLVLYPSAGGGQFMKVALSHGKGTASPTIGKSKYEIAVNYAPAAQPATTGTPGDAPPPSSKSDELVVTKRNDNPLVDVPAAHYPLHTMASLDWAAYWERDASKKMIAKLKIFSPIEFDQGIDFDLEHGFVGRGIVRTPTLSVLRRTQIFVTLDGQVGIEAVITGDELDLPGPFKVRGGQLELGASLSGLTIDGGIDFEIPGLATGSLTGSAANTKGAPTFALDGQLDFDSKMFKPAEVRFSYRDGKWGGGGKLGVQKGMIKGVNGAELDISFDGETFTGKGWVKPAVKALERADLALSYDPRGDSKLTAAIAVGQNVPGIKSGNLAATITRKQGGAYSLSGDVTIEPNVPGVNATIHGSYDDGLFAVEGHLDYRKGMLAGSLDIGVTNQPVGKDGKPAAPAAPPAGAPTGKPAAGGDHLALYGSGSLSLQLAPWLKGTAGVTLKPDGSVKVVGEVAVPDAIDLFPEKKFEKELVHVGIDIPIVGVAVLGQRIGIFATVQGGLSVEAGIGPGQLRGVLVHVEYDPAKEQDTKVTGKAQVYVPAHAGLKLEIRGGLGAGIPIVSATATLGVSGELALMGAAQADFSVDWSPAKGLVIDTVAKISAEPKFLFDITGKVEVTADVWIHTFHLYEKEWNFAHFEYGSGLRLGVSLPVHYEQGKPFDVNFSDIQFEYPHIDPMKVLSDLLHKIA